MEKDQAILRALDLLWQIVKQSRMNYSAKWCYGKRVKILVFDRSSKPNCTIKTYCKAIPLHYSAYCRYWKQVILWKRTHNPNCTINTRIKAIPTVLFGKLVLWKACLNVKYIKAVQTKKEDIVFLPSKKDYRYNLVLYSVFKRLIYFKNSLKCEIY